MMTGYGSLNEAMWGRKPAVVRYGAEPGDRLVVRFDGESKEAGDSFRVVIVEGDPTALDRCIAEGRPVELTFNTPAACIYCDCVPLRRGRKWFTQWASLAYPQNLNAVERRTGSREAVPDDVPIVAVLKSASGGPALRTRPWDLDLTGAGFLCPVHPQFPQPKTGQRYAVRLSYQGIDYDFEGVCRHAQRLSTNSVRVGIQFDARSDFPPATLARFQQLLADLQALRIRRTFRTQLKKTVDYATAT